MITITKGQYEVLTSKRLSLDQKIDSISMWSWPIHHLDGEHEGFIEPANITEEDCLLIIEALKQGNVEEATEVSNDT